jgi:hypothetical protein
MDINEFQKVNKANSSTITFRKKQDFNIKFNEKQERFVVAEDLWQELGLNDNSVIQYNRFDGEMAGVYLQIVPGNDGVFLKKHGDRSKGRAFKNTELISALQDLSSDPYEYKYFSLTFVGNVSGFPMYKVEVDYDRYERLVKDTYEYVLAEHTYRRRVETLFHFIS